MTELWLTNHDAYSHRCRFVISEKNQGLERGIGVKIRDIDINAKPEELALINPLNQAPVLIDRDLQLYESSIICEYLDERFPHPQLMPTSVSCRARTRLFIFHFNNSLYKSMDLILTSKSPNKVKEHRSLLSEQLQFLSKDLSTKFLVGNEITMADVSLAPLLWRLQILDVKLPQRSAPILKYAEKMFARDSFLNSLTPAEKEMWR